MDKYKETTIRLTKMHDPAWVKTISELKTLECNDKDKDYCVTYKKENQRKVREYCFDKVQYVEETKCFIFTSFDRNCMDYSEILDTVASTETLLDIEIEKFEAKDKLDYSDYCFFG